MADDTQAGDTQPGDDMAGVLERLIGAARNVVETVTPTTDSAARAIERLRQAIPATPPPKLRDTVTKTADRAREGAKTTGKVARGAAGLTVNTAKEAVKRTTSTARRVTGRTGDTAKAGAREAADAAKTGARETRQQAKAGAKKTRDTASREADSTATTAKKARAGRADADTPGAGVDYEEWTKAELYDRAQELDISGRSSMTKAELIEALRE